MLATPSGQAHGLVGQSPQMAAIRRLIEKASIHRLPVLLTGESGTGKEVVARAIYNANPRGQFVPIDCGSLVGTLMESELFGHAKGAFSGAVDSKRGLVELADGGTAFFDEIGDLPLDMQVKLLRLLQEGEFRAVGSLQWRKVDLRIIAATHRNLSAEVSAGRFRLDLFYRLNVFALRLPSLRQRKEDIPLLVDHFLGAGNTSGLQGIEPSPELLRHLSKLRLAGQRSRVEALHRPAERAAFGRCAANGRPSLSAAESPPHGRPGEALRRCNALRGRLRVPP